VPSFNLEGGVNFFVARTYTNDWPKYKNPPAHRDIVFNELWVDWDKPIILVEGVFDAIKSGPNSIPLLGSSLRENSRLFQAIVKHGSRIYLALDKDAANKTSHIAKRLMEYDVELYKIDLKDYNDVGEMTHEEFSAVKQDAISVNFENYLLQETLAV
jgi:DNA primase